MVVSAAVDAGSSMVLWLSLWASVVRRASTGNLTEDCAALVRGVSRVDQAERWVTRGTNFRGVVSELLAAVAHGGVARSGRGGSSTGKTLGCGGIKTLGIASRGRSFLLRAGVERGTSGRRLVCRETVRLSSPDNGLCSTGSGFGR